MDHFEAFTFREKEWEGKWKKSLKMNSGKPESDVTKATKGARVVEGLVAIFFHVVENYHEKTAGGHPNLRC